MKRLAYTFVFGAVSALMACGGNTTSGSTTGSGGDNSGGNGTGADGTGGAGADAGAGGGTGVCFEDHNYLVPADFAQYNPVIASHCKGTNHQDITGIERLVFLGDSITEGTFPTGQADFYRTVLADKLTAKFPGLVVDECAVNGARVDDLLAGDQQIMSCFPAAEPRTTLVVITLGGNDVIQWPQDDLSQMEAEADAKNIADTFREAIEWFYADPMRFPNGVFVTFASVYEFTDGTGDLGSCPGANLIGLSGEYIQGATALAKLNELYMEIAVDTGTDMIFTLEEFCGHGYRRDNMNSPCYIPDAEQYFDISCIHPTPAGHHRIAEMFELLVDE